MTDWTFSLQRLLNTPLCCTEAHAAMIVAAVHGRFGIAGLEAEGMEYDALDMQALAATGRETAHDRLRRRDTIYHQNGSVAVIPVRGTLTKRTEAMDPSSGMTGYNRIAQKYSAALDDPEMKAIWLDVDSGGGEASGMLDLMDLIWSTNAKNGGPKPVYAMANDHAYSAAYGILSAADRSFVPRTGGAGSIGTLALIPNRSKKNEKDGVTVKVMRSGSQKARVNMIEPMDEETEAKVQAELDHMRDLFATSVARNIRGKGQSLEAVKKKVLETEGASYMGGQARAIGLVSEVASEQQAWAELLRMI